MAQKLDMDKSLKHFENLVLLYMTKQEKSLRKVRDEFKKNKYLTINELEFAQDDAMSLILAIENYLLIQLLHSGGPAFDFVEGKSLDNEG